jgi:hypothetical protein
MTTDSRNGVHAADRDQLQEEIEAARDRLGETVELLGSKLDMKRQARRHQGVLIGAGSLVAITVLILFWRRR